MLSFVTGNLDRPGGNLYSLGFYPAAKAGAIRNLEPEALFFKSEHGELRTIRGALPGNLLPDLILNDSNPIKALIIIAGNPVPVCSHRETGRAQAARQGYGKIPLSGQTGSG